MSTIWRRLIKSSLQSFISLTTKFLISSTSFSARSWYWGAWKTMQCNTLCTLWKANYTKNEDIIKDLSVSEIINWTFSTPLDDLRDCMKSSSHRFPWWWEMMEDSFNSADSDEHLEIWAIISANSSDKGTNAFICDSNDQRTHAFIRPRSLSLSQIFQYKSKSRPTIAQSWCVHGYSTEESVHGVKIVKK
jgi:hypothetical protein